MIQRQVGAAVLAVCVFTFTATLLAHMKAARSAPASGAVVTTSPAQVQVWFTQAPDPKVSKLDVTGPAGPVSLTRFKVGADKSIAADVQGVLGAGRYVARWQAAGTDGHIQKGEFAFTVKPAR